MQTPPASQVRALTWQPIEKSTKEQQQTHFEKEAIQNFSP